MRVITRPAAAAKQILEHTQTQYIIVFQMIYI